MCPPSSSLLRAVAALLLALALAGCAVQGTGPSAEMLSGGGAVADHSLDEPGSSRPDHDDDTPSFQELPSSESSSPESVGTAPPSSPSSQPAPPPAPSSSQPAASSSQAPPPSSQPEESEPDEEDPEEEPGDDEDEWGPDWEEDDPDEDEPDHRDDRGGSGWEDLKVKYNGSTVSDSAVAIVSRIVQNEVGSTFYDEAIKAQAVAAYTFVRYHNTIGSVPSVGLSSTGGVSDKVARLVREVAGEQVSYNGKPILASYCAISAGVTASAQSVWGSALPYLVPVESKGDPSATGYRATAVFSAGSVKSKLESSLGIRLDGIDPEDWFDIRSYWDDSPYVDKVSIAGKKETTGRALRESILGLRSAAFDVDYDEKRDEFTFTTYGYGHGVGMSQRGANYYAGQGWSYVDILEHYYSGTTVG